MSLDDIIQAKRIQGPPPPPHHRHLHRQPHRHGGGGVRRASFSRSPPRQTSPRRRTFMHSDDHDTERRSWGPGPSAGHQRRQRQPSHCRLIITNLHYEVSREDLRALFESIGPVIRIYMHYDRAGRSNGKAEVTFERGDDARVALERFHQMPLDGLPMHIEMQTGPLQSSIGSSTTTKHEMMELD